MQKYYTVETWFCWQNTQQKHVSIVYFFFCTSSCTMKTWFSYVFGKQNHVFMKGFFWNNNFFKSIWGVNSISRLGISICFSLGPSIWKCVGSFYFHMLFAIFTSLFKKIWNLSFAPSPNPYTICSPLWLLTPLT